MEYRVRRALGRLRYGADWWNTKPQPTLGDLLAYAATLPDEELLSRRNVGPKTLAWIRAHQPAITAEAI